MEHRFSDQYVLDITSRDSIERDSRSLLLFRHCSIDNILPREKTLLPKQPKVLNFFN
eukprot:Pgem_evm1s16082